MRRTTAFLLGAAVWGTLAVGLWLLAVSRPWVPQADFDILGVLWLLTNLPRLFLSGLALLCLVPAGYCVRRVMREST